MGEPQRTISRRFFFLLEFNNATEFHIYKMIKCVSQALPSSLLTDASLIKAQNDIKSLFIGIQ